MKTRFSLACTILVALAVVFTSCSRQQGAVSYNSVKLKQQSVEIENCTYYPYSIIEESKALAASKETTADPSTPSYLSEQQKITSKIESKLKTPKPTIAQKALLKKITKKLSPNGELSSKKSDVDEKVKYAIIFGGIGIVLIILGVLSWVFYTLGVIAIVVGLVFLLLWLLENA